MSSRRTVPEAVLQSRDWKCTCGRCFVEGTTEIDWSELRLGGERLQVMRLRCGACQAPSSRYVRLDEPPP